MVADPNIRSRKKAKTKLNNVTTTEQEVMTMSELAIINSGEFRAVAVIGDTGENLMELLQENVGEQISVFDFAKLTVPSGGGEFWSIPSADGAKVEKEIEGVVLLRKSGKAYWQVSMDDSTELTPPDCSSEDGMIGIGTPGGTCAQCPLNRFETAAKGKGKACKDKCDIFILTKNGVLPMIIQVPPTSLRSFKQYGMLLLDAGKDISKVLTKFSLVSETRSGKKTAIIQFKSGGDIGPEMHPFVAKYKETIKSLMENAKRSGETIEYQGYASDGEAPKFE